MCFTIQCASVQDTTTILNVDFVFLFKAKNANVITVHKLNSSEMADEIHFNPSEISVSIEEF